MDEIAEPFIRRRALSHLERGRIVWSGKPDALRTDADVLERYIGVGGLH